MSVQFVCFIVVVLFGYAADAVEPGASSFSPTPSPPHFYLPATASGTPRPAAFQYAVRSQKPLFLFAMSFF